MTWLHFVGKQYYPSRARFIREAERYGVTRRVSLATLERMHWGDRVVLAIKERASPVVFGTFLIHILSGLSSEASQRLMTLFECEVIPGSEREVKRGCGEYIEGATIVVREAPLPVIARHLRDWKEAGLDIGKPMVGGNFEPHPLVYIPDIPHQQGFRPFDWDRFTQALSDYRAVWPDGRGKGRLPRVRGQFYAAAASDQGPDEGRVQTVEGYRRADGQIQGEEPSRWRPAGSGF